MKPTQALTPAALYARVSSERQDVDLSASPADPSSAACLTKPASPTHLSKRSSSDGHNSNGKLRYSWAVDLGPFKLGRIARE